MSNKIDINQLSETEFQVGENKVSLIKGNIIHVIAQGEQTKEIALNHKKICEMLYSKVNGKVNYLIDLNKCGKNAPEAREIWNELSEHQNTNKVATYGLNPVSRVISSFVMGRLKKGNMHFFKTKEDGINWITS